MTFLKSDGRVSLSAVVIAVVLAALGGNSASAQTLTTSASFNGTNGSKPLYGSLISDANGDLFGTTYEGGPSFSIGGDGGAGTVFEIVKSADGFASTPTTLFNFDWIDEYYPMSGLIADANGDLYGTTSSGGAGSLGTVFELAKTNTGNASMPTVLVNFDGPNGAIPESSLIADASGDLFGTTLAGAIGGGTVFEIAKTTSGYASTPTNLVIFGAGGGGSVGGLAADSKGDLFGTTQFGGASGYGTVFEIAKTSTGCNATPITLVSFNGTDGKFPHSGLIIDANGDLFGAARFGGSSGYGTIFEIVNTASGYASTPTILVTFNYADGAFPMGALIADANGNLFGTTSGGGTVGDGTVFEIANTSSGYANTPTTLINLIGTNGAVPEAGLISDLKGDLFGITYGGGTFQQGTVFEVAGSGFVPPKIFTGTPGTPNCVGESLSTLAQTYGGTSYPATSLGYSSVADLQSAAASYCSQ